MRSFVFGHTALGMAIPAFEWKTNESDPQVFILGGVHGNETEGVVAAHGLLKHFAADYKYKINLTLLPAFNIDGVLSHSRYNGHGVDLNRNLPTNDWNPKAFDAKYPPGPAANSEPENWALVDFIKKNNLKFIFTLHSWKPVINTNGDCNPEAQILSKITGYEIKDEIGYPTPGCLGTYAGLERKIPTITYEIERGLAPDKTLAVHVPAILEALKATEKERR